MKQAVILKAPCTNARDAVGEIWLRGNLRPVTWLAAVATLLAIALTVAAVVLLSSLVALLVAGACLVAAGVVGLLAVAAARPRLERRGGCLRIRLSPMRAEDVPLEAVECFFQGSNPIARSGEPTCGEHAAFRVNTLVMRLAERADAFARRATFTPWGTWDDGYVVFDGRWCEPLSAEFARQIGRRLVEAKRARSQHEASAGRSSVEQTAAGGRP